MAVTIEWKVEVLDADMVAEGHDDPDIIEVNHFDTYAEAMTEVNSHQHARVVLVRDRGNEDEGLICRTHAYIVNGALEPNFTDPVDGFISAKVPAKYHAEVARYHALTA